MELRKDRSLDGLADIGNVAQFVSYAPEASGLAQTFSRVRGYDANHRFADAASAASALLAAAPDGLLNVRSYTPDSPRSREFVYGLGSVAAVVETVERLAAQGLHLILNETVDVADGGVSGVVQAGVVEFAPDDTPRCVEKPGTASLPLRFGMDLLDLVYGFPPALPDLPGRIEFSVHPRPRGWRSTHTLLWEYEEAEAGTHVSAGQDWPNRFSRHLGDKAYGLIMAHLAGLPVPETLVLGRRVAPFRFGRATGAIEGWIRTCPKEQEPGLFTTHKGWLDPYALLAAEDPGGDRIASVLHQSAVPARYSGAAVMAEDGAVTVEGVAGEGDLFMLGRRELQHLPAEVTDAVHALLRRAETAFGPVRMEWVHDGDAAWVVQLHRGAVAGGPTVLVPGDASEWVEFDVSRGLEALRALLPTLDPAVGLSLQGHVGLTSHVADLVRKSGVPARIAAPA